MGNRDGQRMACGHHKEEGHIKLGGITRERESIKYRGQRRSHGCMRTQCSVLVHIRIDQVCFTKRRHPLNVRREEDDVARAP